MHYYLIVVLQVFCFYHVYKTQRPYYWFLIILFIPLLGSLIYILTQVFNKRDADIIQGEITAIVNPSKKVKHLEKKLEFSDSYTNRIDLADAYFEMGAYSDAITNYEHTLLDKVQDSTYSRLQLIRSYFKLKVFKRVIGHAEVIKHSSAFKGSKSQFCYGLTLREIGRVEDAEKQLKLVDRPYSNYSERLALAKFYLDHGKKEEGKDLLEEVLEESKHMTKPNKKQYRTTILEVQRILKTL